MTVRPAPVLEPRASSVTLPFMATRVLPSPRRATRDVPAAARTAAPASSMPAPQVAVVQWHSICETVVSVLHAGAVAPAGRAGNARAVDWSRLCTCMGVSVGWADSIKATVPDTSGAEKLVPRPWVPLPVV